MYIKADFSTRFQLEIYERIGYLRRGIYYSFSVAPAVALSRLAWLKNSFISKCLLNKWTYWNTVLCAQYTDKLAFIMKKLSLASNQCQSHEVCWLHVRQKLDTSLEKNGWNVGWYKLTYFKWRIPNWRIGLTLDARLTWNAHLGNVLGNARRAVCASRCLIGKTR